jgi:hypothetical protein
MDTGTDGVVRIRNYQAFRARFSVRTLFTLLQVSCVHP